MIKKCRPTIEFQVIFEPGPNVMIDIFLYKSPSIFIKAYLNSLTGKEKRGAHQALADSLRIFPSYLSLILKNERQLNLDQGVLLADALKLKKAERRYLYRMIELERAQGQKLKAEIEAEMNEIAATEHQISARVERDQTGLTLEEATQFFSSWKFSAVHLLAAISSNLSPSYIAKKMKLSSQESRDIYNFLMTTELWKKSEKKVEIGPSFIHLDHQSKLLNHHHMNWRLKAIEEHPSMEKDKELAYSLCVALSKEDALKIRSELLKSIANLRKIADPSPSEVVYNLNFDWINLTRE